MAPTYGPWSSRDIVPRKKPAPARKPAAAAHPGGGALTPAQQVAAALRAELAPLDYTEHARQTRDAEDAQQRQNATIAIMRELQGQQAPTAALFDQALKEQQGYASQYAGMLKDANPNADIQAGLAAVGAPQAQRDQLAAAGKANYTGQAGFLFGQQGVIPGNTLLANRNAQVGFLAGLPAVEALAGVQAQSAAGRVSAGQHDQYTADRLRITGQAPGLLQQAQTLDFNQRQSVVQAAVARHNALVSQEQRAQQLALEAQSIGNTAAYHQYSAQAAASRQQLAQDRFAAQQNQFNQTLTLKQQNAADARAAKQQAAAAKAQAAAAKAAGVKVKAGKKRQDFFYSQRAKAIKDAKTLFTGPSSSDPNAPPDAGALTVPGSSSGPTPASPKNPPKKAYTPYKKAYDNLYLTYQPALSAQGFKRFAIRQMIENSLRAAGYKIPPRSTPPPRGPH